MMIRSSQSATNHSNVALLIGVIPASAWDGIFIRTMEGVWFLSEPNKIHMESEVLSRYFTLVVDVSASRVYNDLCIGL